MASKLARGDQKVLTFDHDFSVNPVNSGGTFALGDLPTGFVIQSLRVVAANHTASATVALGEDGGGDADGFLVATDLGANVRGAGALLYDNTDKEPLEHVVADANDGLLMTVGSANLVAGTLQVFVQGYQS